MKGRNKLIKLAPSMLSADFSNLEREIAAIEKVGTPYLHLDIMDGHFVPNITFGAPVVKCIRPVSKMVFDVHLMIENPEKYIEDFVKAGADIINVHVETTEDISALVDYIKTFPVKSAVTIKPDTPVSAIECVLNKVDMVLVMTVYPGFSGQKLIPEALENIRILDRIRKDKGYNYEIEIDGGVNTENLDRVMETGVDIIVAGSAVFGAEHPGKAAAEFIDRFRKHEENH